MPPTKNQLAEAAKAKAAPVAAPAPEPTQLYSVVKHLHHDNKPYYAGDPVELTEKQAAPLLALGAIEAPVADDFAEEVTA